MIPGAFLICLSLAAAAGMTALAITDPQGAAASPAHRPASPAPQGRARRFLRALCARMLSTLVASAGHRTDAPPAAVARALHRGARVVVRERTVHGWRIAWRA